MQNGIVLLMNEWLIICVAAQVDEDSRQQAHSRWEVAPGAEQHGALETVLNG